MQGCKVFRILHPCILTLVERRFLPRDGCDRCDGKFHIPPISLFPVTAVTPVMREAEKEECKGAKYLYTYTLALLLRQIPVPLSIVLS